jgi:peptide/nickel transport system substrate-binding protein
MQLGYSTSSLDLFWPSAPALPAPTVSSEALLPRASPPQRAVQVLWNVRRDPLNQPLVREALSTAVDRRAVITNALQGKGRPQGSLFAPGLWLSSATVAETSDAPRAEQLLASAGWLRNVQGHASNPNGTLLLTLLAPNDQPALVRIAAELRLQWARPGIQIIVKPQPRAEVMRAIKSGSFDGVVLDAPLETSWDLWPQWHSDEPGNVTGFADRQVDLLLEALKHEFQPGEAAPPSATCRGSHPGQPRGAATGHPV